MAFDNRCGLSLRAGHGIAADQVSSREVGDGQRIAVALVAEHELPLEVRAPKFVRRGESGQRGALGVVAAFAVVVDLVVAIGN